MNQNYPWTFEFEEMSGYDGMSAAYVVSDANGRRIFKIDTDDFTGDADGWEARHAECPAARELAQSICDGTKLLPVQG